MMLKSIRAQVNITSVALAAELSKQDFCLRNRLVASASTCNCAPQVYAPDSGCEYFQYTRGEVLEYFQAEATDILVVGDSFMRQLFVRLTHLMRGQVSWLLA